MPRRPLRPMLERFKPWRLVAGALLVGLSTTACAQLSPSALVPRFGGSDTQSTDTTPDTANVPLSASSADPANPAALGPNQVAVALGSIEETFTAPGRVAC